MSAMQVGTRGAAERFAAALDGTGRITDLPASLAELVGVAERAATLPQPRMAPDASARIRQRLVAVAAVQAAAANGTAGAAAAATEPASAARALSWRARRLAAVAVGTLTGVTAVAGVAVGAAHSVPGDPFYALKRATEGIQLDLAGSPAAKADRELQFARARLSELRAIGVDSSHAAALLRDMRTEFSGAQGDALTAVRTDHDALPLRRFQSTSRQQVAALFGLAGHAPVALLPELRATVVKIVQLDRSVQHAVSRLPGVPTIVPVPGGGHRASTPPTRHSSPAPHRTTSLPTSVRPSVHRTTGPTSGAPQGTSTGRARTSPSITRSGPLGKITSKLPKPLRSLTSAVPSDLNSLLSGLPLGKSPSK